LFPFSFKEAVKTLSWPLGRDLQYSLFLNQFVVGSLGSKGGGGAVMRALASTNVARVQIPSSTPYVGWVCCWFSPLLREVFLRVLRFSPLLKNQHFQIPIRPGIRWTKNHYVYVLPANRYFLFILFIYLSPNSTAKLSRSWEQVLVGNFCAYKGFINDR